MKVTCLWAGLLFYLLSLRKNASLGKDTVWKAKEQSVRVIKYHLECLKMPKRERFFDSSVLYSTVRKGHKTKAKYGNGDYSPTTLPRETMIRFDLASRLNGEGLMQSDMVWKTINMLEYYCVFIIIVTLIYNTEKRSTRHGVFSVDLVCKEELNLKLKVSDF